MGLQETEAIVLRTHRLGEADKIVIMLTRDAGVVRGTARGARKMKSRYGASLEPFTHIRVSYFEKESRELVSLGQTEIVRSHFELLADDRAYTLLEYLGELILEFSPPHEPNEKLFRMVSATLEDFARSPAAGAGLARYFEIWTLKLAGFWPELKACARCRRPLAPPAGDAPPAYVQGAALVCGPCASAAGLLVHAEVLAHLRAAGRQRPGDWAEGLSRLPEAEQAQLARLNAHLITRALEREPRGQPRAV
ncbi:MAG TPA: DNA repair protein RecO [Pyrinomonadaceae bacterium]|nr:DNA repair protein RecO [Pyrinomonadaceae bacterium]